MMPSPLKVVKQVFSSAQESGTLEPDWLYGISYLYLFFPFIIFCLTWLKLPIGLAIAIIFVWLLWRNRGLVSNKISISFVRSEERRVGKECTG
jgi:hypothetical protein